MTPQQSADWHEGGWWKVALDDDVFEWAYRGNIHREEIIVVTSDHQIAWVERADQWRA